MLKALKMIATIVPFVLFVATNGLAGASNDFSRPYAAVVSVENFRGLHICNGILVAENVVLTAAHCVDGISANLNVRVGSLVVGFGGQVISVLKNCPISGYDFLTKKNDITVLRLSSAVSGVTPAKLPSNGTSSDIIVGSVQGWGFDTNGGLQAVPVVRIGDAACKSKYGSNAILDGMVCLAYASGRNSCLDGAQGSAVLQRNTVVAINAALGNCVPLGPPGVYTKINGTTIQEDIDSCA